MAYPSIVCALGVVIDQKYRVSLRVNSRNW